MKNINCNIYMIHFQFHSNILYNHALSSQTLLKYCREIDVHLTLILTFTKTSARFEVHKTLLKLWKAVKFYCVRGVIHIDYQNLRTSFWAFLTGADDSSRNLLSSQLHQEVSWDQQLVSLLNGRNNANCNDGCYILVQYF